MMNPPEVFKLAELRAKTDRELLIVVETELERGLTLAHVAASKGSVLHQRAENFHAQIARLLPRIAGLSVDEQRRLQAKLTELRVTLDQVPAQKIERPKTCQASAD